MLNSSPRLPRGVRSPRQVTPRVLAHPIDPDLALYSKLIGLCCDCLHQRYRVCSKSIKTLRSLDLLREQCT